MKLTLNPEYNLYERDGKAFCDSLMVAETFEKRHDNVLRDIENLECSENFNLLNFEEIKYKDSKGRRYPKYLMTKDGFTLLVMGYTGKKAMQFKEAYINRFNQMEHFIKSLSAARMDFPAFTEAVMLAHEEPKSYHYSNEVNMIYRIVLGMDAKTFRKQNGIDAGEVIKPFLSTEQIKAIENLQRIDIGLLEAEIDYPQRKNLLSNRYQRMSLKLIA